MNEEILKIRKLRGLSEKFDKKPSKLPDMLMSDKIYVLNNNMGELYLKVLHNDVNIDDFIEKLIANLYIVLDIFNEMRIYPDYFYDAVVKMNKDYRSYVDNSNSLRGNYELFNNINLSSKITKTIREGLEKGKYLIDSYPKKDLNDMFTEMISFLETYKIPFDINDKTQCKKAFSDIEYNHINIMDSLSNSDYDFVDIECLSRLLFEYISFFASVGINPKEFLDEYIEEQEKVKRK
jgi:hypothetical protein